MPNSITLGTGESVLVDPEDYARLSQLKWWRHGNKNRAYARRRVYINGKEDHRTFMHREILPPSEGLEIDHINGNGLDNRKCNLRLCTRMQNQYNRNKQNKGNPSSKYKGVAFSKRSDKWVAYIRVKGLRIHLGYFENETDAAIAYNKAAIEYFKEYANINLLTA